jgi:hypothetical protein
LLLGKASVCAEQQYNSIEEFAAEKIAEHGTANYMSAEQALNLANQEMERRRQAAQQQAAPLPQPAAQQTQTDPIPRYAAPVYDAPQYPAPQDSAYSYSAYPAYPAYPVYPAYPQQMVYAQQVWEAQQAWAAWQAQQVWHAQQVAYGRQPRYSAVEASLGLVPVGSRRAQEPQQVAAVYAPMQPEPEPTPPPVATGPPEPAPTGETPGQQDQHAAQIHIATQSGKTEATLTENTGQLATIKDLQAQQLAIEHQRMSLEQERMALESDRRKIQNLVLIGILGSIPLVVAIGWVTTKILAEVRLLQEGKRRDTL